MQLLLDLCEGLSGTPNRSPEASDAESAPLLRGTTRKTTSRTPHTIAVGHAATLLGTTGKSTSLNPPMIAGYPCGDSARDLRSSPVDQQAVGSRTTSVEPTLLRRPTSPRREVKGDSRRRPDEKENNYDLCQNWTPWMTILTITPLDDAWDLLDHPPCRKSAAPYGEPTGRQRAG